MPFDKTKFQPTVMPSFVEDYRTGDIVGYVKRDGSWGNLFSDKRPFNPDGGMSYVLSQVNVPRVLIPSGVANASGRLTLNSSLPWVLPGDVLVYTPPNLVVGDATGGWKTATFSAANICQLVGNPVTTVGAYAQTTALITFQSVTVPGKSMGPNGSLRNTVLYAMTASANGKVVQGFFGGNIFGPNNTITNSVVSYALISTMRNMGVENRQIGQNVTGDFGSTAGTMNIGSVDTTIDRQLTIAGSLSAGAVTANEYLALMGSTVELLQGT